jgi:two-component system cell cycle response regulator
MRILIADDDAVCRRVLEGTLRRLGHSYQSANDGDSAWNLFHQGGVDVILSDWMMPGIDGIELCRRVRAASTEQFGSAYTYFLMLTSLEDRGHFMSGMRAGADDYLVKPLNPMDLEARLLVAERVTRLHQEMQEMNRKLWDLARRDALTTLYNRLQLSDDLDHLRSRVDQKNESWTLALCDVDHFKRYNDYYGHLAGDDVLRRVSHVLRTASPQGKDTSEVMAYRYGGEEFCLLMNLPPTSARTVLEEIRCQITDMEIRHIGNTPAGIVTISVGMAPILPGDSQSMDSVLRAADSALYLAKQQGRNRVISDSAPVMAVSFA